MLNSELYMWNQALPKLPSMTYEAAQQRLIYSLPRSGERRLDINLGVRNGVKRVSRSNGDLYCSNGLSHGRRNADAGTGELDIQGGMDCKALPNRVRDGMMPAAVKQVKLALRSACAAKS